MKRKMIIIVFALLVFSMTSYAGQWELADRGWRYRNDDGTYAAGGWLGDQATGYFYRMDGNGYMITGWWTPAQESGIWYYLNPANSGIAIPEGALVGGANVEGYQIAADGLWKNDAVLQKAVDENTKKFLEKTGYDLKAVYDYCATKIPYVWSSWSSHDGTNTFAELGYLNGTGNCYTMAAIFCKAAKALGYDCRQMAGYVPGKNGKMLPHSWCEITIDGQTRVYDPDFTYETGRDGYGISYGQKGTWMYRDYAEMPQ